MSSARTWRALAAFILLLGTSWAAALEVHDATPVTGSAGEYVTLGFDLVGAGTYAYTVNVEAPWEPLATTGQVRLDGTGYTSVTLRVPRAARGGTRTEVSVRFVNVDDPSDSAEGTGYVEVRPTADVSLVAPERQDGLVGQPLELTLLLTNRGNLTDTFTLRASSAMWLPRFEAQEVTLEAGEQRALTVVLEPIGTVSHGYRNFLVVTATSGNSPEVTARTFTESVFEEPGRSASASKNTAPRLEVAVGLGVAAGVTFAEENADVRLGYGAVPSLSGELSDYARVSAGVGRLSGSLLDPFEEVPSRFDMVLATDAWDATASIGNGSYSVGGGGMVGDWRIGGSGTYSSLLTGAALRMNAFAISQRPDLDLQFAASTSLLPGGRSDALGATYRTRLGDDLVLGVGSTLAGFHGEDGYGVVVGVHQSLAYQAQAFDITQTYNGVPQTGLHSVGLSGGLRSAGPFGVRASTTLVLSPASLGWRNALTLSTRLAKGLGATVTGTIYTAPAETTWSVAPSLSFSTAAAGWRFGVTTAFAHSGVISGSAQPTDRITVSAGAGTGPFDLNANATYMWRHGSAAGGGSDRSEPLPASDAFTVSVSASYKPGVATSLVAKFEYASDTFTGEEATVVGAGWGQRWSDSFSTALTYDKTFNLYPSAGAPRQSDRLAVVAQFRDVGLDGLDVSAGYALSSRGGFFTGAPVNHDLSVRLGYVLRFSFDTPGPVVSLFGGRKGGEVRGVAYIDRDLDGAYGPQDEPLAGLEVELGGERAITGADGSFSIRVRSGEHFWSFGGGMPAGIQLLDDAAVEVVEDGIVEVELGLSPVVNLNVTLFDDADNDGAWGTGEGGISFGGVIIEGPVRKAVTVDARGNATVSGLVPGRYTIRPDPDRLPARYRTTTEPVVITLREGDKPAPVLVGAGAPPRQVVTTFAGGGMAIMARAVSPSTTAGADLEVIALVSGDPDQVTGYLGSHEFPLEFVGGRWGGTVHVPEGTPAGRTSVRVVAVRNEASAESSFDITIR